MNKLNLELWVEDSINLSNTDFGKTVEFNFNGEIWEFDLHSIKINNDFDSISNFLSTSHVVRVVSGSTHSVTGTVRNKSKKLLKEAKEHVRKKQAEFKEAQRKLSELMNK